MSLRSWLTGRRTRKVTRYLTAHPTVAMDVLRQAPALAAAAVRTEVDLAAMANLQRQSLAYPILTQMGYGGKHPLSSALPKPTAFNLRRWSEYPPARRAINAICNPLLDLPWQIVPTEERLEEVPVDKLPGELRQRIMRATAMLQRPNNQDSWRVWLEQVLEDICVGGYGAAEIGIVGDGDAESRPAFLWPVDGQSIRLNVEWDGQPHTIRYTQSLGYVGLTVATHDPVPFTDDELIYFRLNPRTHTPFGFGYLECAFNAINAYIGAFDYAQRKASNATPNFLIFLGENTDIPTTRQWSQYWQQMIEGYGKAPIIGGGREPKVLDLTGSMSQDPLYLKWQEWIVRQIALAFGLSSMKLGLERDVNRTTAETMAIEDWETVAPVAQTVADGLNTHLFDHVLGWDDIKFKWIIHTTDTLRQSEVLRNRYESDSITIDEQRQSWGDPPLPNGRGQWTRTEFEAMHDPRRLTPLPSLGEEDESEMGDEPPGLGESGDEDAAT